jgi:hypothetical protein
MIEAIEKLRQLGIILDAGPGAAPHARFYCHAKSEEGRVVTSRLETTLDTALASIRWTDLDPEPAPEPQPDVPTHTEHNRSDLFDRFKKRLARKSGTGLERDE